MDSLRSQTPRREHASWWPLLILGTVLLQTGCSSWVSRGTLHIQSRGVDPVRLDETCTIAVYTYDKNGETSFWLSNVSLEALRRGDVEEGLVIHLELLWLPKAGATPMDPSATNVSIRYTIISHGEVGVYVGAGFAEVRGKLHRSGVAISVRDATLELGDSTPGFLDLLTPAQLGGDFTASHDDEATRDLSRAASQFVTNALGRTRFVQRAESSLGEKFALVANPIIPAASAAQ